MTKGDKFLSLERCYEDGKLPSHEIITEYDEQVLYINVREIAKPMPKYICKTLWGTEKHVYWVHNLNLSLQGKNQNTLNGTTLMLSSLISSVCEAQQTLILE